MALKAWIERLEGQVEVLSLDWAGKQAELKVQAAGMNPSGKEASSG